ncbi:hypothetical protein A9306_09480 [Moraxella atlantae]|uniref:Uncharacterized protein n=1 Tax=Faucicola atlantae TaxID=34059 RepID=A0A1B8QC59_9GAMM|nr:hypothetical protein A9306_09480 [Moraxella atlantae]
MVLPCSCKKKVQSKYGQTIGILARSLSHYSLSRTLHNTKPKVTTAKKIRQRGKAVARIVFLYRTKQNSIKDQPHNRYSLLAKICYNAGQDCYF